MRASLFGKPDFVKDVATAFAYAWMRSVPAKDTVVPATGAFFKGRGLRNAGRLGALLERDVSDNEELFEDAGIVLLCDRVEVCGKHNRKVGFLALVETGILKCLLCQVADFAGWY